MLKKYINKSLKELEEKGLKRELRCVEGAQSRQIFLDGKTVLNFCSNNYLGLADDKRLTAAAIDSLERDGVGSGASRLVCGNMASHNVLEEKLAAFKRKQRCLVFSTGYMANIGIISSLFDRHDCIFEDKLNHASLIDGARLSQAKIKRYAHNDMDMLRRLLSGSRGAKKKVIITDSVFSMDGDLAPLDKIVALAKEFDCMVMIDEAHAFGVLGKSGRGAAEHFGVEDDIDIVMGTLSKAAGCFGAYCCGTSALISFLQNKARSFIYTTGMPASVAAAATQAVELIEASHDRRERLWENTRYMLSQLKLQGFNVGESQTPIIPLILGDAALTLEFSRRLLREGIFISAIRPPTVPEHTARLRLSLMATHTKEDCDFVLDKLSKIGEELCHL
ncbi:8-amino-7-oxononanoate synthase [Candidatus Omnitrophota bacterium]